MRWLVLAALAVLIWWQCFRREPAQKDPTTIVRRRPPNLGMTALAGDAARSRIFRVKDAVSDCGCSSS